MAIDFRPGKKALDSSDIWVSTSFDGSYGKDIKGDIKGGSSKDKSLSVPGGRGEGSTDDPTVPIRYYREISRDGRESISLRRRRAVSGYKLKLLAAPRRSLIRRVTICRVTPARFISRGPLSLAGLYKSPELKLYISVETPVLSLFLSFLLVRAHAKSAFSLSDVTSLATPSPLAALADDLLNALRAAGILGECKTLPVTFTTNRELLDCREKLAGPSVLTSIFFFFLLSNWREERGTRA